MRNRVTKAKEKMKRKGERKERKREKRLGWYKNSANSSECENKK